MAVTFIEPLGSVITPEGRVDVKLLARSIDQSVPALARALGKSARHLNDSPTARSVQSRALRIVGHVNSLAGELGGVKFALAWLNTPTPELGGKSAMDLLLSGDDRSFEVALRHIDSYLMMDPD